MPTKEELLNKYSVKPKAESVVLTKSKKEQSSKDELFKKYEVNLDKNKTSSSSNQPTKSWTDDLYDFFFSSQPNALEQGLEAGFNAATSGAAKGLDFIGNLYQGGPDYMGPGEGPNYIDKSGQLTRQRPDNAISQFYKEQTGYEPQSFPEKAIEKGSEFFVGGMGLPGGQAIRAPRILADIGAGLGFASAEELGFGVGGQLGGGIAGSLLPTAVQAILNPRQALANAAMMFKNGGNQVFKEGGEQALQASLRQKVNPPLSNILESAPVKKIEQMVAKNKSVGGNWFGQMNKEFAEAFLQNVTQDVRESYQNAIQSGSDTKNFVKEIYKENTRKFNDLYDSVKEKAPDFKTRPEPLANSIEDLKTHVKPGSPATDEVLQDVKNMENLIFDTVTETKYEFNPTTKLLEPRQVTRKVLKELTLPELIDLRSMANQAYRKAKNLQGSRRLKLSLPEAINESIESLKKSHPEVYKELKQIDKEFKMFREDEFGFKVISKIRNAETGSEVLSLIKNPEQYDQVANVLNKYPGGKEILKNINQAKFEELFSKVILDARKEGFRPDKFVDVFNKPEIAAWADRILTPAQKQSLGDLQLLSNGIVKGGELMRVRATVMKSAPEAIKLASLITGIGKILAGDFSGGLQSGAIFAAPTILARMYVNPKFRMKLIRAAELANEGNMSMFERKMTDILEEVAEGIGSKKKDQDQ